jgi:hypothetical protein
VSSYREMIDKLHDRFVRGEVSEKTFLEIKARYEDRIREEEAREKPPAKGGDGDPIAAAAGPSAEGIPPAEGGVPDFEDAMRRAERELERRMQEIEEQIRSRVEEAARSVAQASSRPAGAAGQTGAATSSVSGAGLSVYDQVKSKHFSCAGACRVQGDLEAETARSAGALKIMGSLKVGDAECSGATKVMGDISAGRVRASGAFKCLGGANIRELEVSGSFGVAGSLAVGKGRASGAFEVGGSLGGDDVECSGKVELKGDAKLRRFKLRLNGESTARGIEADEITVENPAQGEFFRRLFHKGGRLTADRLKGRVVRIEWTHANYVEGDEVEVGQASRVQHVKARKLTVSEFARVERREMVPGPPKQPPQKRK